MSYIGKIPATGNFVKLDAISVVNGQASYTMQSGSVNFTPESANHMLVSLNGVIQSPLSSFTVSGSTITFASALSTGDVINFIMVYGNVLDIGTPSDSTVTNAKTNFTSTSSAAGLQIKGDGTTDGTLQLNCSQNSHGIKLKSPAHSAGQSYTLTFPTTAPQADKALITDGSGNLSFGDAGGGEWTKLLHTTASSVSEVAFNSTYLTSTYQDYKIVFSNVHAVSDNDTLLSRFSTDNGSNFKTLDQNVSGFKDDGGSVHARYSTAHAHLQLHNNESVGNDAGLHVSGFIEIFDPSATDNRKLVLGRSGMNLGDTAFAFVHNVIGAMTQDTDAINYIKISWNSGNIASGEFTLYGRKIT